MDKKNKNPNVPNLRFNNNPYKKYNLYEFATRVTRKNKDNVSNVIKLRNDEPSRYYCLDGVFI